LFAGGTRFSYDTTDNFYTLFTEQTEQTVRLSNTATYLNLT
jgi:hypothetical protein